MADLCPSICCTTLTSAPEAIASDAAVWRSSCLLARMHSTTIASTERFTVDLVAMETADHDGAAPLLGPASIALYGLEDSPQLSAADALDLADALRAAAARLPQLDEAPR